MAHEEADISDAVTAVMMVEASNNSLNVISNENTLHTDFADDPDEAQKQQNIRVLHALNLVHLLRKDDDDDDDTKVARTGGHLPPTSQWNFRGAATDQNIGIITSPSPSSKKKSELRLFSSRPPPPPISSSSSSKRRRVE